MGKDNNNNNNNNMKKLPDITSSDAPLPEGIETDLRAACHLNVLENASLEDERIKALINEDLRMRAFMEDIVTFSIVPSHDKNDPPYVESGVNGVIKRFERGKVYKAERKFIDSLIRTQMNVETINYKDDNNVDQTTIRTSHSLVYPLQIHHDPAGDQGRRWFIFQQNNAY